MNKLYDNIQKLKFKSFDLIKNFTHIEPSKYLSNSIKTLINDQDKEMLSGKYINCLGNNQINLSHRLLLFFDIIQQINININSIITIQPYFWFKKFDLSTKSQFVKAYTLHLCKNISYDNIIYNPIDLEKKDEYNKAYSPKSLSNLILKKYDFIYGELLRDKKDFLIKIYIDDLGALIDFSLNNLNIGGSVAILTSKLTNESLKFIELIISKNIFTHYSIIQSKYISVISYLSMSKIILLNNFTGKKIYSNELSKIIIDFDNNVNVDEFSLNYDIVVYNTFERLYYEIYNIQNKDELQIYIYNNILEYCNNIKIFIGSKYVHEKKIKIWKELLLNKLKYVLYNTDNDINLLFTFIVNNLLKDSGMIYVLDNNNGKIVKKIHNVEFIDDIEIVNNKTFDLIFISDSISKHNLKNIFLQIQKQWNILNNNGYMIFDNIIDTYINYKQSFDLFYKLYIDEINILYLDYSHIIIKKI
jgi:hypothetical protein